MEGCVCMCVCVHVPGWEVCVCVHVPGWEVCVCTYLDGMVCACVCARTWMEWWMKGCVCVCTYKASTGAGMTYMAAVSNASNLGARARMECVSEDGDGFEWTRMGGEDGVCEWLRGQGWSV